MFLLLALPFVGGCESNDPSVDISDVAWVTSGWKADGDFVYEIDQNEYLYFMNASQGALSTTWEISPEAQFMVDNFNDNMDIASQAAPEKGFTSNNIVESVYFPVAGTHFVKLTTTFNEWVKSHDDSPTEAVYSEALGVWLYEHTFSVVVKQPLAMGYQVIHLGENKIYDDTDKVIFERVAGKNNPKETEISINDGDVLLFRNTSTGDDLVEAVTWVVNGETFEGWVGDLEYTFNYDDSADAENTITDFSLMIERVERPAVDITADLLMSLTVNPSPLKASFTITKADGSEVAADTTIERGDKLFFNDQSEGTDYTKSWSYLYSEEGSTYEMETITLDADGGYTFTKAGSYKLFALKIENDELYPEGSTTSTMVKSFVLTVAVPEFGISDVSLNIEVTATHGNSDTPTIEIAMNNTLAVLPSFTNSNGGFTLSVEDYAGVQHSVNVTSVAANGAKLILSLDAKIFEGDKVKLSYTEDQPIEDVDGAVIADFADRVIAITGDTDLYKSNTDVDFETGTTAAANGWVGPSSIANTSIDTTMAASGSNSVLIVDAYDNGFKGKAGATASSSLFYSASSSVGLNLPAGNYLMKHSIRIENAPLNAAASYTTRSKDYDTSDSGWTFDLDNNDEQVKFSYPAADSKWHTQSSVVKSSGGTAVKTSIMIYSIQEGSDNFSAGMKIWFDDFKIIPIR